MRAFLRRAGRDWPWYRAWTSEPATSSFQERNPLWPLRAWAGLVLERIEREEAAV